MADELRFEWDKANLAPIRRRDVLRREAEEVLRNDPLDLNYEMVDDEERWTSIGHSGSVRVLLLVWTLRGGITRVVTAWDATKPARLAYLRKKGITL